MLTDVAMKFIEDRGLDVELATKYGVSEKDGWIVIPYEENGRTVNRKSRKIADKDFRQEKGGKQILWNADVLGDSGLESAPIVVTEGEMDALAAIQAGYPRAVAFGGGAPQEPIGADAAKYAPFDALRKSPGQIILAFDGDQAGRSLLQDIRHRLGAGRCKFVGAYPKGCKDLGEALKAFGVEGVRKTIDKAQWCETAGMVAPILEFPKPAMEAVYPTGFQGLDPLYKVRLGEFCVVTGVPGHGKSTWTTVLAMQLAELHGWQVGIFSPEHNLRRLGERMVRWAMGRSDLLGKNRDKPEQFVLDHVVGIGPRPHNEDPVSVRWFLEQAEAAVNRYGCKVIICDPWNEMEHFRARDETTTEYVGWAIREIKSFTAEYGVHMIVVAHPKKVDRPQDVGLYTISDSAHWANKPDVGIVIRRQEDLTQVDVKKVRDQDYVGKPGDAWYSFCSETMRFQQAVPPEEVEAARPKKSKYVG